MWNLRTAAILLAFGLVFLVVAALRQPAASPIEFVSSVDVKLTPEQSWQRLSDLSLAQNYVPGIVRTEITSSKSRGVGASRRVYSSATELIYETVTVWDENSGFTLLLQDENGRAPMPFKDANFSYRLTGTPDGGSTVQLMLKFVVHGGALGEWLVRKVAAKTLQDRMDLIAKGLKAFYEAEDSVRGG